MNCDREQISALMDGELTPAQAAEQLRAIGETPESMTRKSAQLVEAVQVLQNPNNRGTPAPDVFTENVLNRLENRQLMRILDRVETGQLTAAEARAQIQELEAAKKKPATPEAKPVEGIGATTRRQANNALGLLWVLSTTAEAGAEEGRLAAEAGEEPGRQRAVISALAEASMIPGIIRSYQHGKEVGKEEMEKADKEGRSRTDALLSGF